MVGSFVAQRKLNKKIKHISPHTLRAQEQRPNQAIHERKAPAHGGTKIIHHGESRRGGRKYSH